MKKIEFGTNPNGKSEACFVAFYTTHRVYNTEYGRALGEAAQKAVINLLLMIHRWDGMIGLPGGKVDEGETLKQAAVREVKEEVNFDITEAQLEPVVSFEFGIVTHLYAVEVDYVTMSQLQRNALDAPHIHAETTGTFLAHMMHGFGAYSKGKGLPAIFASALAKSVREELVVMMKQFFKMPSEQIKDALKAAGYEDLSYLADEEATSEVKSMNFFS